MKRSIPSDVWETKKAVIARLYKDEEWPLKQVTKQIRSADFNPSETQLRSKLKKWRVTKPSRQTKKKPQPRRLDLDDDSVDEDKLLPGRTRTAPASPATASTTQPASPQTNGKTPSAEPDDSTHNTRQSQSHLSVATAMSTDAWVPQQQPRNNDLYSPLHVSYPSCRPLIDMAPPIQYTSEGYSASPDTCCHWSTNKAFALQWYPDHLAGGHQLQTDQLYTSASLGPSVLCPQPQQPGYSQLPQSSQQTEFKNLNPWAHLLPEGYFPGVAEPSEACARRRGKQLEKADGTVDFTFPQIYSIPGQDPT